MHVVVVVTSLDTKRNFEIITIVVVNETLDLVKSEVIRSSPFRVCIL